MTDPHGSTRFVALDAFRGLAIAGMILVNNPGRWGASHQYPALAHAAWHGWTPTDLVFPFFLFIAGVAIPLALGRRLDAGANRLPILWKITRRCVLLVAIGIFLAAFPVVVFEPEFGWKPGLDTLRFPGVLQRIGVCYLLASILFLWGLRRGLGWWIAGLLLGYWAVLALVPAPDAVQPIVDAAGQGVCPYDLPHTSLASWVDRQVFGEHVWRAAKVYDPEGLLSTWPALCTCLLGVWAGQLLRTGADARENVARLMVPGFGLFVVGVCWDLWFPINKPLWTSSYVCVTGGLALLFLGWFLWVCDVRGRVAWTWPLRVYGVNALLVFVGSGLLGRLLGTTVWFRVGEGTALKAWFVTNALDPGLSPKNASLAYALLWVSLWFVVLAVLWRRRIVWKV